MRRRAFALALLTLLALPIAACGSTGTDQSQAGVTAPPDTPDIADTADGGAFPVTVEHRYGSTTIEDRPERIVSLDNQWTDVLVALDAPLVGAALDPVVDGGRYPWQDAIPESVGDIPVTDSIPYEAVAALRPDLIVITWGVQDSADYDRLSAIAPTIPLLADGEVDRWQDIAAAAGRVLDLQEQSDALIDEDDRRTRDLATELSGLRGKTYALANYVPGDAIYVVADPDDGAATFFARLGLQIDPDLLAVADGASGRVKLSLERIGELDADLLILLTNGAEPADITGYAALPAVGRGSVALLDLAAVTGLNTPTPLSLPYSIDRIRPALEAAA